MLVHVLQLTGPPPPTESGMIQLQMSIWESLIEGHGLSRDRHEIL